MTAKRRIELGLLYSRSGTYTLISEACRTGVLQAIAEVNASDDFDVTFVPVERDPGGSADEYGAAAEDIFRSSAARHIFGCVTSWSRKETIPALEKNGGTLWYAVPYEGFEASDHVVYTHACPNQHLLPVLSWAMATFGGKGFLTGSNYIWGWEMNRLAREVMTANGGDVLGERYLPLGALDIERILEEIRASRPNFILNNLIGPSQYAFLDAYRKLGEEDAHFRADNCPILSCNLTECELPAINPKSAEGLVSAGPYFRGAQGWPGGGCAFGSSTEAAAWSGLHKLSRLLNGRPGAETLSLSELLTQAAGPDVGIDPSTHHCELPCLIAQVENGGFVPRVRHAALPGDPYLSRGRDLAAFGSSKPGPDLRVIP